jgi:hypothetical protein
LNQIDSAASTSARVLAAKVHDFGELSVSRYTVFLRQRIKGKKKPDAPPRYRKDTIDSGKQLESVDAIEQRDVSALVRGFHLIWPLFSFNSHLSPKNPAAAIRPGARVEAGVLRSITAQSGSFGVWRALLE